MCTASCYTNLASYRAILMHIYVYDAELRLVTVNKGEDAVHGSSWPSGFVKLQAVQKAAGVDK